MADPVTAGILVATVASTVMATAGKVQGEQQQAQVSEYNANVLNQQATIARNVAGANMATSERRSAAVLGEQAAGYGQANIGTGRTVAEQERQSAGNARLDALNIWYGGELEARQATAEAQAQRYEALTAKSDETTSLIGGGLKLGTQALMAGYNYNEGLPLTTGLGSAPTLGY